MISGLVIGIILSAQNQTVSIGCLTQDNTIP